MNEFEEVQPKSITEWGNWLRSHSQQSESIWLVLAKKDSGLNYIPVEEVILEALCWGWIDSTPNKLDQSRFKIRFSKRNPKSNWSKVNKDRIAKLKAEGRLQQQALEAIRLAKSSGTWDALNEVENLIIPKDLNEEFSRYKESLSNFENFAPSTQRGILEWIFNAKRPETRSKRIFETASLAAVNEIANQYKRK